MCHRSCVTCQVPGVRFQVSGVRCQVSGVTFFLAGVGDKVVELVGGGSVINRASLSSLVW